MSYLTVFSVNDHGPEEPHATHLQHNIRAEVAQFSTEYLSHLCRILAQPLFLYHLNSHSQSNAKISHFNIIIALSSIEIHERGIGILYL